MIVVSDLCGRADIGSNPIKIDVSNCGLYSSNCSLFIAGTKPINNIILTLLKIIACLVEFHLINNAQIHYFCIVFYVKLQN
jgi:hypothetical protein